MDFFPISINKHWKKINLVEEEGGTFSWRAIFYFIRSVRIRIGDRKGSASAEGCQHFATRSKDSNSTPGYGVHPSVAEEQCHAQAAPAPPPVHPSIGQTIGKRREQFAAITSRQQWRHRDRICNVSDKEFFLSLEWMREKKKYVERESNREKKDM